MRNPAYNVVCDVVINNQTGCALLHLSAHESDFATLAQNGALSEEFSGYGRRPTSFGEADKATNNITVVD